MTFATKKGSQRYSKQKNMLTPELNISANFTTADRISSETLWAYCAELKKTKAVIFALCIRGRVKAMINLVQYNIGPGTMIAIPSESFVQVLKTSDDVQLHAVLFSLAFIHETHLDRSIIHTFYIINEHPLLPLSPKIFGIYVQTFALLTHIHKDAPFLFSHATLKSMLEALLQGFTELSQRKALSQVAPANKHSAVFRQFVRLVQENHARQHQVQFYAAEMGMKSTTLCHIIKKESGGQTAMEIINSILILAARTLLRTTPTPVKDIALNLGFNNAAFFNKFFKKQVGMTPQTFRNAEK